MISRRTKTRSLTQVVELIMHTPYALAARRRLYATLYAMLSLSFSTPIIKLNNKTNTNRMQQQWKSDGRTTHRANEERSQHKAGIYESSGLQQQLVLRAAFCVHNPAFFFRCPGKVITKKHTHAHLQLIGVLQRTRIWNTFGRNHKHK